MIKVLVATTVSQGCAPGDFCFVPEGELVGRYSVVCDSERPDGSGCGCGRSFAGFDTHKATTTAMVVESDLSAEQWRARLHQTLSDTGWAGAMSPEELAQLIDEIEEFDLTQIQQVPVGTVVGRRAYNDSQWRTTDHLLLRGSPAA